MECFEGGGKKVLYSAKQTQIKFSLFPQRIQGGKKYPGNEILAWTRTPNWYFGSPMDLAMDNLTMVIRKSAMTDYLIGFEEN